MVVGERDGRHAEFCAHGAQAHPLTLEVGVVLCELGNRACFGVGHDREIVAGSIVARDKEAHEVTFARYNGPPAVRSTLPVQVTIMPSWRMPNGLDPAPMVTVRVSSRITQWTYCTEPVRSASSEPRNSTGTELRSFSRTRR